MNTTARAFSFVGSVKEIVPPKDAILVSEPGSCHEPSKLEGDP